MNSNLEKDPRERYDIVRYHGLLNQGATCYLNSVLQVLFMTEDFRAAVERGNPATECIDRHLKTLFGDLRERTARTLEITKELGINRVTEQRDAAEYFEKILGLISPEASKTFHGLLTHKTMCLSCDRETSNDGAFWHLPLALVDSYTERNSVVKGIEKYFRASYFCGDNQMYCEECDAKSDAAIRCVIKHHPDVLVLLLKRFNFDYRYMTYVKDCATVDVSSTIWIPEDQIYELYAVVDHFGDLKGGHYTATIKSQDDKSWYKFDDTSVTLLSDQTFHMDNRSSSAYLLYYRKMKVPAADNCSQDIKEVATPGGFPPATGDIKHQSQDAVETRKVDEVAKSFKVQGRKQRTPDIGGDFKQGFSGRHDTSLNNQDEMRQRRLMGVKKGKDSDRDEEYQGHKDDVGQNINEDMGGTQDVGQDYDPKPVSVDEQGDGKRMEKEDKTEMEGTSEADEREKELETKKLLTKYDLCRSETQGDGKVGDGGGERVETYGRVDKNGKADERGKLLTKYDLCRKDGASKLNMPKDDQTKQHFGQDVEDQNNGGTDGIRQSRSALKISIKTTAGDTPVRPGFNGDKVEGICQSKLITNEEETPGSSETECTSIETVGETSEQDTLSKGVCQLKLSESPLPEPKKHATKRVTDNAQEENETNSTDQSQAKLKKNSLTDKSSLQDWNV